MLPQDYLLNYFSLTIKLPFKEEHLKPNWSAKFLDIELENKDSLEKARATAICMVLYIAHLAVIESFYSKYKDIIRDQDSLEAIIDKATGLFMTIVESERAQSDLPTYFDSVYRAMLELGPISNVAPAFPLASAAIAPLRAKAEKENKDDFSLLWAGQYTDGCKEISAAQLTRELSHQII